MSAPQTFEEFDVSENVPQSDEERREFNLWNVRAAAVRAWDAGHLAGSTEAPFNFSEHLQRQREWSEKTFGPDYHPSKIVKHIRKELDEVLAATHDLVEWIDVILIAFDGAWRAGYSPDQIIEALVEKQEKNEGRTWPDWRESSEDEPMEHVRDGEAEG